MIINMLINEFLIILNKNKIRIKIIFMYFYSNET
jgi:hypothetical protein